MDIIQTETQLNSEAVHLIFISSNNGNFIFLKQMLSQRRETSEIFISFNIVIKYLDLHFDFGQKNKDSHTTLLEGNATEKMEQPAAEGTSGTFVIKK